jgi:CRISPR-associated protein Cas5d
MTPSAARNILRAILRKPEFEWHIHEIQVLREIQYGSLMRNEIGKKASVGAAPLYIEEQRTQRHALILVDVAYRIIADVWLYESAREEGETQQEYRAQFRRRVHAGQYHKAPYFGCREFSLFFEEEPEGGESPIALSRPLGRMLFDFGNFQPDGRATPFFFHASLDAGVMRVPQHLYDLVNWRRSNVAPTSS